MSLLEKSTREINQIQVHHASIRLKNAEIKAVSNNQKTEPKGAIAEKTEIKVTTETAIKLETTEIIEITEKIEINATIEIATSVQTKDSNKIFRKEIRLIQGINPTKETNPRMAINLLLQIKGSITSRINKVSMEISNLVNTAINKTMKVKTSLAQTAANAVNQTNMVTILTA